MTGPLNDGGPITGGPALDINAFTTMHGHQRGRRTRDTEPLMRTIGTRVLLYARPVRRGGPSNLEALATMVGDQLERVGSDGGELELLGGRPGTTALSRGRAGALRAARDFQALLTMRRRE